jgi:glutamate synthase domain-containing protein 3
MMLEEPKARLELDSNQVQRVKVEGEVTKIDAEGLYYRDLNRLLRAICKDGVKKVEIRGVCGQRYIGTDLDSQMQIDVYGTPGNDLGAFMNGPKIIVHGNVQDACGNTMNEGLIVVHGCAGDLTANSMRGGKIFIRDSVGYRVAIHMKEYQNKKPTLVVGGVAQDFFAEYMAGGVALVLGLNVEQGKKCVARFVGTGMHGGVLYTRGDIFKLSEGCKVAKAGKRDMRVIEGLVREFCGYFGNNPADVMGKQFYKITPMSKRPYEKLYSH